MYIRNMSKHTQIPQGVRQGCILSPDIFSSYGKNIWGPCKDLLISIVELWYGQIGCQTFCFHDMYQWTLYIPVDMICINGHNKLCMVVHPWKHVQKEFKKEFKNSY